MNQPYHANLLCAWLGILLGFISGLVFGLFFQNENWLGGYGCFKRRMYRLGHISFFGLAIVNFMFYLTGPAFAANSALALIAARAFIIGAIAMPVCCLLMAHFPRTRLLFAIPVISLILGASLTVISLIHRSAHPLIQSAL